MDFPRWLCPSHPGSGLLFGYLFGYVAWLLLIGSFSWTDRRLPPARHFSYGLLWALPWCGLWCLSGTIALNSVGYPATLVSLVGIGSGTCYSLATGPFDGWQSLTIPFRSFVHSFFGHVIVGIPWMAIKTWNAEPPEE